MNIRTWLANVVGAKRLELYRLKTSIDLQTGNAPAAVWKDFLRWLRDQAHLRSEDVPPSLASVLGAVPDTFFVRGLREPARCPLSRVVEARGFLEYNVEQSVGLECDYGMSALTLGKLLASPALRGRFRGNLRGKHNFFWCAPSESLDKIQASHKAASADAIRDGLGLGHWTTPDLMLRIDIPPEKLDGRVVRAPTAIDGADNFFFVPAGSKDGFGRAVDLERRTDGLPEVVVESIPFDRSFAVQPIGQLSSRPLAFDDDALRTVCLSRGRS